ncbi:MAG: PIN domain-containing protein [Chloroflexi bacterium]|nr:PIN domain-containing protein [Chloroflexota bacterium]
MSGPHSPRVFVDADVLFAAAASPSKHSASLVVLRMAEITLIKAIASEQVIVEVERNLAEKLPQALPTFRLIVDRSLHMVSDPQREDLVPFVGMADPKDLPILVAAMQAACPWLLTFNQRHFQPGHPDVTVLRPGEFVSRVRMLLTDIQP